MTIPVTINLPDEIYQRADRFARLANRDLASIITDSIVSSLPPISAQIDQLQPIDQMSDRLILELANSQMPPDQDIRISELLAKQRESELTADEPQELKTLMQVYNEGWLRKTAGLVEASKRGLMKPMSS